MREERNRYILMNVEASSPLTERDIQEAIWEAVKTLFGEYGASQANLSLIEFNPQKNCAVVRCSHTALEMVRASVASVTKMNEKPAVIHVLGVSGTLRALRKKALLQG